MRNKIRLAAMTVVLCASSALAAQSADSQAASAAAGAQGQPEPMIAAAVDADAEVDDSPQLQMRALPRKGDEILWELHERVPLGTESLILKNEKRKTTLLASAEAPELEGITVFKRKGVRYVVHSDGTMVRRLPAQITFRVSASDALDLKEAPIKLDLDDDTEHFASNLKFVVKVFRGLDERKFEPIAVKQVGVPLSVPSSSRIYRASFDFGSLDVNDHVVLLVNTSDGAPIAKFFLQLK